MTERIGDRPPAESIDSTAIDGSVSGNRRLLHVGRDRPIRISAGHRIQHHEGKCSRPHGHNYEISVSVAGRLTDEGWVADKGDITDVLFEWDHMFLLEAGDPLVEAFEATGDDDGVVVLEQPPTAEVMSVVLERKLEAALPDTVTEVAVRVSETRELCGGSEI
ncbi:6-pyruvoyl trahydropterin synthase family protein [Natrinema caseinilyticum]|uniref:6-pyruvoyl trahydropterin synthase family protein n=1 Tax=Natrinema caseinilyticum TaxID=2961570 RepID=UPI0020C2B53B|nr:6-pyruvoyl tetrahydropterin synthase family protein [Natrinema caseinilyticum]